jgi:hypothetical protein
MLQPLDKRVSGSRYDDVELLGRMLVRGPAWRPLGMAIHAANGAAFGAAFALARTRLPGRALAQATWRHLLFGVVLGLLEPRLNPPGNTGPVPSAQLPASPTGRHP